MSGQKQRDRMLEDVHKKLQKQDGSWIKNLGLGDLLRGS